MTSGISYEATDERDEVFHLGVLLAQMLSANQLAETVYNDENLREHKFTYIPGITLSMNKVLENVYIVISCRDIKLLHDC